jgi:hypothetical protein
MKEEIKSAGLEKASIEKQEPREKSPYMSRSIYNNYEKGMKERNQKRKGQHLTALKIRTYEEWANG